MVVGDSILDEFVVGAPTRLCRERPVPVVVRRAEHAFPGGAANTAANVRALGAQVRFVTALGLGHVGRKLRELLRERDIETAGIVDAPDGCAARKRRILAEEHYLARVDDEPSGFDHSDVQREIAARLREAASGCDAVLVSDYGGGVIGPVVLRVLEELPRSVPLVVDARDLERYAHLDADVITPNLDEAAFFAGVRTPDPGERDDVAALARRVADSLRARAVAVTLGGEGVYVARDGDGRCIDGRRVAVHNTCGAGDSFVAALTLALAAGSHLDEAALLGLEAAAVAVAKPFTASVSLAELRERLDLLGALAPPPVLPGNDPGSVAARVRMRRERGERIVLTNGVFDLLHAGHIDLLNRARAHGDVLVVALNSDASAALIKGPNRPINDHAHRRAVLEALHCVDEVVTFDGLTAEEIIETLRPDVYVRGDDWPLEHLPEAHAARRIGAEVKLLPRTGDLTTSRIIERVAARTPHWSPDVKN